MEKSLLRQCFGNFITGITVVTTRHQDSPIGFTANSFTSVSLDPPLLLICIDNSSDNIDSFKQSKTFGINILADDQADMSNRFSSVMDNRFEGISWHVSEHGNPELEGISAFFDCSLEATHQAGDHTILIGRIHDCYHTDKNGLGYFQGCYVTVASEDH